MTDLTEQWKKGELPEGIYYCNTGNTVETLFTWGKNYHQLTNNKDEVYIPEMDDCEILAPVPSYEEWQALKASYEMSNDANLKQATWMVDMEKEKSQLKELLKQAETQIIAYKNNDTLPERAFYEKEVEELLGKIDEVLNA